MKNDKCKICALKVRFDQDKVAKEYEVENFFTTLRDLQRENIIDSGYSRRIFASVGTDGSGDKSEMCALNSAFFLPKNKNKKCPDFILNMGLSIPDALSLNVARSTDKLTADIHKMTLIILVLTVVAVVIAIL